MIQSRHRSLSLSSLSFLLLELSFGPARDHLLLDGGQKENIENNSLGQQNVVAIVRLPFPSLSPFHLANRAVGEKKTTSAQ